MSELCGENRILFTLWGMADSVLPRCLYSLDRVLLSLSRRELAQAEELAEYYCRRPLDPDGRSTPTAFRPCVRKASGCPKAANATLHISTPCAAPLTTFRSPSAFSIIPGMFTILSRPRP